VGLTNSRERERREKLREKCALSLSLARAQQACASAKRIFPYEQSAARRLPPWSARRTRFLASVGCLVGCMRWQRIIRRAERCAALARLFVHARIYLLVNQTALDLYCLKCSLTADMMMCARAPALRKLHIQSPLWADSQVERTGCGCLRCKENQGSFCTLLLAFYLLLHTDESQHVAECSRLIY